MSGDREPNRQTTHSPARCTQKARAPCHNAADVRCPMMMNGRMHACTVRMCMTCTNMSTRMRAIRASRHTKSGDQCEIKRCIVNFLLVLCESYLPSIVRGFCCCLIVCSRYIYYMSCIMCRILRLCDARSYSHSDTHTHTHTYPRLCAPCFIKLE